LTTPRFAGRVVCGLSEDDRDLAAASGVHERRLADVRTSGDRDEPRTSQLERLGRSSAGVRVTTSPSAFLKVTRSNRNS
jgi:hypothetical protein